MDATGSLGTTPAPLAYFVPEDPSDPLVEEMTCSVCMELLNNPSEIQPCTHMYCEACQRSLTKCPECRGPIQGKRAVNRKLLNLLDSIKGKCTLCDWTGTFGGFRENHRPSVHNQPATPRQREPSTPQPNTTNSNAGGTARHANREGAWDDHRMRVQTLLANLQNIRQEGTAYYTSSTSTTTTGNTSHFTSSSASNPITNSTPTQDVFNNMPDELIRRIRTVFHELAEDVPMASLPLVQTSDRLFANDGVTPRTVSVLRPCVAYQACHQLGWAATTSSDIMEMFRINEVSLEDLPVASAMTTIGALLPRPTTGPLSRILGGVNGLVFTSMAPVVTLFQFTEWASLRSDVWNRAAMSRHYSIPQPLLDEALSYFPTVATQALLSEENATQLATRFIVSHSGRGFLEMITMVMQNVHDLKDTAVRAAASCTVPVQQILMRSREAKVVTNHHGSSCITLDHVLLACASGLGSATRQPAPPVYTDRRNTVGSAFGGIHSSSGSGSIQMGSRFDPSSRVEEINEPLPTTYQPPPVHQQQRNPPPSAGIERRRQEQERNAAGISAVASAHSVNVPINIDVAVIERIRIVFHDLAEDVPMASLPLVEASDRLFANDGVTPRTVSALRPSVAYQACHQLGWAATTSSDILQLFSMSEIPLENVPVGYALITAHGLLPRPTTGRLSEIREGAFTSMAPVITLAQFLRWASTRKELWDRAAIAESYTLPQSVLEVALVRFQQLSSRALLHENTATDMVSEILAAMTTQPGTDERVTAAMRTVKDLKDAAVRAAASCTVPVQQILMRSREAKVQLGNSFITLDHVLRACSALNIVESDPVAPRMGFFERRRKLTQERQERERRAAEEMARNLATDPSGEAERGSSERRGRDRADDDAEYDQVPDLDTLLRGDGAAAAASSSSSAPPEADAFPGQRLTFFRRVQRSFVRKGRGKE